MVCPSFSTQTTFAVGANPVGITNADFNGDGIPDLAVSNLLDDTVSVLLGTGSGTFGPQTTFAVGDTPQGIISADFNGNGTPDLAVPNFNDDTVSVLLGNGSGGFGPQTTFAVGDFPLGITSADLNGGGVPDLAVTNANDGTVSVLLGTGSGTFGPQTTFAVGGFPVGVTSADFNGDGFLDLAVTNSSDNTVSVLLNTGTGSFGPQTTFAVGANPQEITSADFNDDGIPDLAVTNQDDDTVSVLLGDGLGGFQPQTTFAVGDLPQGITNADFNCDGFPDLAVINVDDNTVSVLLGTGSGAFLPQTTFAVGVVPLEITSADFNGDGTPDLAVTNAGDNNVSVLLDSCVTPLTCSDLTLDNDPGTCEATVPFQTPQCPNVSTVSSPATVPVGGPTLVTSTATSNVDPANIEPCTFTVTVIDTEPPVISGLNDIETETTIDCGAIVTFSEPTVTDNCPGTITTSFSPASGSFFPLGSTLVTFTAIDSNGNSAMGTFTVTVRDTEPPVITELNDVDVEANNSIGTIVTYPDPTVTDNCPGTITISCNPPSGSFFFIGSTVVTCTAIDSNGNSATGTFTVTVFPFEEE
ncbi:Repeat domain-containing protein [Marininema mesophilum]|uniref:Repeat domain-containing protein n=1 Tax=Marininema mesophilum TaxID=1048340 RepID=A0A1H3CUP6_9BACL|nr:FG-GAP-like repeat-containing protein [Marininema mesophilum]SDX57867.1 Repeat domain-containing protein [Marininema mesophilum]